MDKYRKFYNNHVNDRTITAIDSIEFWDYYLDNPDEIV